MDDDERKTFWQRMHEGFADLRDEPEAWKAYQGEVSLWDSTVSDGLEHEEPYYTRDEEEEIAAEFAKFRGR